MVNRYIDQGIAELVPGVLFIDEVPLQSTALQVWCYAACALAWIAQASF